MELKMPFKPRVLPAFVITGFMLPIFFAGVWVTASIIDGDWIFGKETLSEMGVCTVPAAEMVFNFGCVITGALGFNTGYGMLRHEKNWLFLTGFFTMVGMVFLMGVGAIDKSYGTPHITCAITFFVLMMIAMLCSIIGDWVRGRRMYSVAAAVLLGICGISTTMGLALMEALCIICLLVWCFLQAWRYYKIIGFIEFEDPIAIIFDGSEELR